MSRVLKKSLAVLVALVFVAGGLPQVGRAALDLQQAALASSDTELVVVEADNCIYCDLFHRDVAPVYARSERAKTVPMRFVDINAVETEGLTITAPIDSVPTVLVVEAKRETGRIPGYIGPESFFHSVNYLLGSLD